MQRHFYCNVVATEGRANVMDKGYDFERIHELTREKLEATTMIPFRQREKRIKRTYQRKMKYELDEEIYHRRNLVKRCSRSLKENMGKVSVQKNIDIK